MFLYFWELGLKSISAPYLIIVLATELGYLLHVVLLILSDSASKGGAESTLAQGYVVALWCGEHSFGLLWRVYHLELCILRCWMELAGNTCQL